MFRLSDTDLSKKTTVNNLIWYAPPCWIKTITHIMFLSTGPSKKEMGEIWKPQNKKKQKKKEVDTHGFMVRSCHVYQTCKNLCSENDGRCRGEKHSSYLNTEKAVIFTKHDLYLDAKGSGL